MFSGNETDFQNAISSKRFADIGDILTELWPYLIAAAAIFLLIYLVIGGFGIMTSRSDPKALDAARGKITTAITGFIIIFVAYWLVQLLGELLGIKEITDVFKGGSRVAPPTP